MNALPYIAMVVLICFSAFFSGSEIAYTSVNRMRLEKLADGGSRTAKRALKIRDRFDRTLPMILIGNNFVNIATSAIATLIAIELSGGQSWGAVVATAIITVVILIFGEIVPKIICQQNSETVTRLVAYPVSVLIILLFPITWLVAKLLEFLSRGWHIEEDAPTVTEDELVSIIETVEEEGVIDEDKSDLLQSAIEFADITVEEILIPRTETLAIDIDDEPDEIKRIIDSSTYSRLPVYEKTIDNIIGILSINHYYKAMTDGKNPEIRPLLKEPCQFHKTAKLPAVLAEMRRRQLHLGIVIDEYGGTMGIVTMEDILEQIVGDIYDESDEIVPDFVKTGDDVYTVSGDMNVYDFFEEVDVDDRDFESEYNTIGGWAVEMLDSNPHEGDSFEYKNLYIIVSKMDDLCVDKLTVKVLPVKEEEDEE